MKVFVPMLAAHTGISDQDLLEKDVRLHLLLEGLVKAGTPGSNLIFKGGTCLIKCYLDYPRFSTDLDFTWHSEPAWESLGTNELRRAMRPAQRKLVEQLVALAAAQGFAFDKTKDVLYEQSNRMLTVQLRYESVARLPSLVKVQVNFTEPLHYPPKRVDAHGLLKGGLPGPLKLLDTDLPLRYARAVQTEAYDPREIIAEKGRAILTRTAAKTRDVLDLYLIETSLGLKLEDHAKAILTKTRHSMAQAKRYQEKLETVDERFEVLLEEDVGHLLLKPVNNRAFNAYRSRAVALLRRLSDQMRSG